MIPQPKELSPRFEWLNCRRHMIKHLLNDSEWENSWCHVLVGIDSLVVELEEIKKRRVLAQQRLMRIRCSKLSQETCKLSVCNMGCKAIDLDKLDDVYQSLVFAAVRMAQEVPRIARSTSKISNNEQCHFLYIMSNMLSAVFGCLVRDTHKSKEWTVLTAYYPYQTKELIRIEQLVDICNRIIKQYGFNIHYYNDKTWCRDSVLRVSIMERTQSLIWQ
jgi:hypothetical protein